MKLVKDVISAKGNAVWSVNPDASVKSAIDLLVEKNIGAVPVLNSDGSIIGIFSERDYLRACANSNDLCLECPVSDVMTSQVICINPEQTIDNCMAILTDKRIRHLPVLEGGKMTAIISIGDIVKSVINEKEILIDQLEHYIEGSL
jgi:CBS domain-containing protein